MGNQSMCAIAKLSRSLENTFSGRSKKQKSPLSCGLLSVSHLRILANAGRQIISALYSLQKRLESTALANDPAKARFHAGFDVFLNCG
jgi:hypothetical protein